MRVDEFKLFLMVDGSDDELFLTKTIFHLAHPGVPFRCERDPALAMSHLRAAIAAGTPPARICVLLDIRMPRFNGFELIYRLRNEVDTYGCRILVVTASQVSGDRDHAVAIGADGFVTKPFKIANLEKALALCPDAAYAA